MEAIYRILAFVFIGLMLGFWGAILHRHYKLVRDTARSLFTVFSWVALIGSILTVAVDDKRMRWLLLGFFVSVAILTYILLQL